MSRILKSWKGACPNCGNDGEVEGDRFDGDGFGAWQRCWCVKCGCSWDEVYEFSYAEIYDEEEA